MKKEFPLLAIETTADLCSVSVLMDEKNYIEVNFLQKHIHSQKLMDMISFAVNESKIKLADFAAVAVSIGPGSFTGLRIGLSAAKGIAFGSNLPIIPVPTFEAHALQISSILTDGSAFSLLFNASIEDLYFASYSSFNNSYKMVKPLILIGKDELTKYVNDIDQLFGNIALKDKDVKQSYLSANSVAKWAYLFGQDLVTFDYDNMEPNYLKQFIGKVKNEK